MRTQTRLEKISTAISLFGMAVGFSVLGFLIVMNQHDGGASITGGILGILLGAAFLIAACLHAASSGSCRFNPLAELRINTEYEVGDVQNLALLMVDPEGQGTQTRRSLAKNRRQRRAKETPDLTPLSSTCALWRPCVAFQQFHSGVFPAGVRRQRCRVLPLAPDSASPAPCGPLDSLQGDHTL